MDVDTKKGILETLAPLLSTRSEIKSKSSETDAKYNRIISNQQKMMKNQNLIMSTLAKMNRSFREVLIKHQPETVIPQTASSVPQSTPQSRLFIPNPPSFEFKPISTREELDEFENNLKDKDYLNTFAVNMSNNCWNSGRQLGLDVCYFLVDLMFTRRFMTICSWTGGSRSTEEKIPFKVYKNTINVFFNLVYEIDNSFTMHYCESFFKAVLKNSVKRCVVGITRCSKIKRRPKNLMYKKKKEMLREQICQRKEQGAEGRLVVDLTEDNENGYKAEY